MKPATFTINAGQVRTLNALVTNRKDTHPIELFSDGTGMMATDLRDNRVIVEMDFYGTPEGVAPLHRPGIDTDEKATPAAVPSEGEIAAYGTPPSVFTDPGAVTDDTGVTVSDEHIRSMARIVATTLGRVDRLEAGRGGLIVFCLFNTALGLLGVFV